MMAEPLPKKANPDGSNPRKGFEYLDHTADIQVHSWGSNVKEAFEQATIAMFGYMTELDKIDIDEGVTSEFEVEGHDLMSLLYALLDEFLFRFSAEDNLVCKDVEIVEMDLDAFKIKVKGKGEVFDLKKHPQGTEIKAITYSNMQIHTEKPTNDVYVILDI
eukprot:TRINITY_DN10281_c0_g1_i4.p2 TRINITY_DN10281_c0_g1~~TRINITY_DN10281_c0_g1_i4.p2  ORF type:complete len:161 (+),score=32.26 TRINITY_DN10281_c0_g1_i4:995-1477(+)